MGHKRKNTNININVSYLNRVIQNSGISKGAFAATIGRTVSYINNALTRGYMQRAAAELLCKQHGARMDLLCLKEHPIEQGTNEGEDATHDDGIMEVLLRVEQKLDYLISQLG